VTGILQRRRACAARRRGDERLDRRRCVLIERFVRAFVVYSSRNRLNRLLRLQDPDGGLVASAFNVRCIRRGARSVRMSGLDQFRVDAESNPPHREQRQAARR